MSKMLSFQENLKITFAIHSTLIPALGKNEKASHEVSALFFTRGRFKVDIQCKSDTKFGTSSSAVLPHVYKFIPSIEITVN